MTPNTQLLLYALLAVALLIVLIARFKLHPFIALITVSLALGIVVGMPLGTVVKAFQDGVATVLGFIAIVVALGTMLGKMMAESGAAARIAATLISRFGEKRVHWALMFVGFIVGIPVFFQVGFVLLIPLVFTIARRSGLSLVKIGIPLVAGLSVVHGMVPPHPAAMLAVVAFQADTGRTIAYALVVGLPTAALAGPIFASWVAPRIALPAENPVALQFTGGTGGASDTALPSFGISLFTVLLPVILMLCASAADLALDSTSTVRAAIDFAGGPIVALLLALLFSFWSLGSRQHFTRDEILKFANDCLAPTATILLVIGAGGGFNRVLIESGVGKAIADVALGSHASPLLLAWSVAALIRVATGSATVAMTTSAGIVAPIAAATPGTSPELLVLATGAGSLVLSHVNDAGFWLIKEFFNMTVPQTLKTWTVTETIIGVAGLAFTLLLSLFVGGCGRPDASAPWIDVTATLDPARTPVYEGDAPMKFEFLKDMRNGDKFTLSVYSMGAHSGTHIDAPMHFIAGGAPVDQVALEPLIGPARVIEIPDSVQAIDAAELNRHDWRNAKRVLFRTRSSLRGWMDSSTFHRDFAYIAPDAAQLLADGGVALVGVDYISAEQFGAPAPRTHQILLGRGIPIAEGLDLRPVAQGDYDVIVLPLKVRGHEGAPARAIMRKLTATVR